ncbi:MAG: OsmC family peroxiredoxin, partial [Mucilaginibacter sp.]|nr:OsmC family peroxiredoxin [Mucilaginibacter sp.]
VSEDKFKEIAEGAKANCIVSKALSVPITLNVSYQ